MGARTTEKYPLGIWANDWAAGHLTSDVVQIIIQDWKFNHGALGVFRVALGSERISSQVFAKKLRGQSSVP